MAQCINNNSNECTNRPALHFKALTALQVYDTRMREDALIQAVNRGLMLKWLKKHAMRLPAGPLTPQQERDIAECFQLLDEDGSGALDVSELVKAFKLLGFKVCLNNSRC